MRRRFFVERFEGGTARLEGAAAHHLGRVLRAGPGQVYELSDGRAVWLARIERVRRGAVEFALLEPVAAREPALRATLLLSIIKFGRFEWCLEKAAELGIAEILPLAAARSEKALVAAAGKRMARWERILWEAAQQARLLRPPRLAPVARSPGAFAHAGHALCILLSERQEAPPLRTVLAGQRTRDVALAIGPEGGWTDKEFEAARAANWQEASLGQTILRTETAVIATLAILHYALPE